MAKTKGNVKIVTQKQPKPPQASKAKEVKI